MVLPRENNSDELTASSLKSFKRHQQLKCLYYKTLWASMKFDIIVLGVSSSCDALNWAIARPFFLIVVSALSHKQYKMEINIVEDD